MQKLFNNIDFSICNKNSLIQKLLNAYKLLTYYRQYYRLNSLLKKNKKSSLYWK